MIEESEIQLDFIRSTGPGGQNVNKVATACQLRFDVFHSSSLPDEVKKRLIKLAGKRMTDEGVLVIEARRYRTQEKNRADAIARLEALIQKARIRPVVRRPTKLSASSKAARLDAKKKRGQTKQSRRVHASDLE